MFNFLSVLPDFVHLSAIPPSLSWIRVSQALHRWCLSSAADWSLVLLQSGYREFPTKQQLLPSASARSLLCFFRPSPIVRSQEKVQQSDLSLFLWFLGYRFRSFRILSEHSAFLGEQYCCSRSWIQGAIPVRSWLNLPE